MPNDEMAAAIALQEACHTHSMAMDHGRAQGAAYVWGRQDERGTQDTGPSFEFGKVWGALLALHAAEALSGHGPMQAAYLEWAATGSVVVTVSVPEQRGVFALHCPGEFEWPAIAPVPWASSYVGSHIYREPAQRHARDMESPSV